MSTFSYVLRDATEGIQRNKKAAIGAIMLIFLSLSITGCLSLLKNGVSNVVEYLDSQVKIRIIVENSEKEKVIKRLIHHPYIQNIEVESGEKMYEKLKKMTKENDVILKNFQTEEFPSTIIISTKEQKQIPLLIPKLEKMDTVQHIFYPQQMAEKIMTWTKKVQQTGIIFSILLLISCFLTVSLAIYLSFIQRKKEVKIKLLIGAKKSYVRNQFLTEGFILGFLGSVFSVFSILLCYRFVVKPIEKQFPFLEFSSFSSLGNAVFLVVALGIGIGLAGSYLSTKKAIEKA